MYSTRSPLSYCSKIDRVWPAGPGLASHPWDAGQLQLEPGEDGQMQLDDVVADDEGGKHPDADEGGLEDVLLDLHGEVAAEEALDQQQKDHSAVEDGERQQIDHAQVDGDH